MRSAATSLAWIDVAPIVPGAYWTQIRDGKRTVTCVRSVRHNENADGLVVELDPTFPEMTQGLGAWCANWSPLWSVNPVAPPPTG